jgi:anti-sigma factor RsiW
VQLTSCDVDLLSRYLDGELMLPQRVALEEHLRICAPCAREMADLRRADALVAALGESPRPIPIATEERIRRAAGRPHRLRPITSISRMMPAAVGSTVAAVLVVLSVNAGMLYRSSSPTPDTPTASQAATAIAKRSAALIKTRRTAAVFGSTVATQPQFTEQQLRRIQMDLN